MNFASTNLKTWLQAYIDYTLFTCFYSMMYIFIHHFYLLVSNMCSFLQVCIFFSCDTSVWQFSIKTTQGWRSQIWSQFALLGNWFHISNATSVQQICKQKLTSEMTKKTI